MLYKLLNGMLLFQQLPSFFYTRKDATTWLLMHTGMHEWLLNNYTGCVLFDIVFYMMPLLYLCVCSLSKRFSSATAIIMFMVNFIYLQCYTLYPGSSIEAYIGWMLFPIAFVPNNEKTFGYLFQGLRYVLLYIFVSSAMWKIVQGGLFNTEQMSGVLLYQHADFLNSSPGYWQSAMLAWLIEHSFISYMLYLSVALLQFSCITGFFTKKYDKALLSFILVFFIADYFIMRIVFFDLAVLMLPLLKWKELKTGEQ